jgi:hypothetical protein
LFLLCVALTVLATQRPLTLYLLADKGVGMRNTCLPSCQLCEAAAYNGSDTTRKLLLIVELSTPTARVTGVLCRRG